MNCELSAIIERGLVGRISGGVVETIRDGKPTPEVTMLGDTDDAQGAAADLLIGTKGSSWGLLAKGAAEDRAKLSMSLKDSLLLDLSSNSKRAILNLQDLRSADIVPYSCSLFDSWASKLFFSSTNDLTSDLILV